ncbi:gle-1-related [Holotrichia oblita]|uniref:Gle-1-related n=1 Tax=Holotrichia oblita TaxID=644536 RepID=A0ACB9TJB8_HOLOL|nr:gle-1-related [Holotrichia oblita]
MDENIKKPIGEVSQKLKMLILEMEDITKKCKTSVSNVEVQKSTDLLAQMVVLKDEVQKIIIDYNKQKEIHLKEQQNKLVKEMQPNLSAATSISKQEPSTPENVSIAKIDKFVSKASFRIYSEMQGFLLNHQKTYTDLLADQNLKQFKFDCKKAVNIPVNAISAQSGAAFCYGTIILSLWNECPDLGKLLLAHFHKQCPYLVPIHLPKAIGETDEDYYTSLGYQYVDGVVEKQDKFLKRMTGIMRLYSAIIISKPKKSQKGLNPHGLTQGWRWLTATLNLEPKTDITATLIHVFLETAGCTMQNVYKNEFKKIIAFIITVYMPMLKKIDSGGPYTRLEVLLQEYQSKGQFFEPSGILPATYW